MGIKSGVFLFSFWRVKAYFGNGMKVVVACALVVLCGVMIFPVMGQSLPRSLASVDSEIECICGDSSSYGERVALVHRLPGNLSAGQLVRCREFLEHSLAGQSLPDLEFNGLKNEVVFALMRQREGLVELSEVLVRMALSPETDETWRDYCVQFLGKCYPKVTDELSREAMSEVLWEVLRTCRSGRAAGSAARQLMMLSRSFSEFPAERVASASLEALQDSGCSEESQTALLQVCGTLGERGALSIARSIAERTTIPVLRASAIAAIGMLGDDSDLGVLQRLAASGDARVAVPARAAMERIRGVRTAEP
jgi:hypothetical protein